MSEPPVRQQIPLYTSLPKEVLAVRSRIDLPINIRQDNKDDMLDKFLRETIPRRQIDDDFHRSFLTNRNHSAKQEKLQERPKKNVLNSAERHKLFNIGKGADLKYETFEKINQLWRKYIATVSLIPKADFHGAHFAIFESKNPSLVGISGIVVQETKHVFKLITKDNSIKIIPKCGTTFAFAIGEAIYKLNGDAIKMNPVLRTQMKLKSR